MTTTIGEAGASLVGERIAVIGNTSAGKSTLAARLAAAIGGVHVELDALYWLPDWTHSETADFQAKIQAAIEGQPRWASSGNYITRGQPILWPQADTVVWLDMPLPTILRRVVTRSWQRHRGGELLWGTNTEDFWSHLKLWNTEESLIAFAIRYHRTKQRQFIAEFHDPRWAHLRKYRLRSPEAVERFASRVERESSVSQPVTP